jgi:hypothetical protein
MTGESCSDTNPYIMIDNKCGKTTAFREQNLDFFLSNTLKPACHLGLLMVACYAFFFTCVAIKCRSPSDRKHGICAMNRRPRSQ